MCIKWETLFKIAAVLLAILLAFILWQTWERNHTEETPADETVISTEMPESPAPESVKQTGAPESVMQTTAPTEEKQMEQSGKDLGKGLVLLDVSKYAGIYMEDGSDEIVSDVLMLLVENSGEQDMQYAEITVPTSAGEARFSLTTLPAGEKIVVLEQNRMLWSADEDYSNVSAKNIALFSESMDLHENQLEFQNLDGVMNVTNISDKDINGDITIYYKNAATDLLYGGITYRIRLEGGLKAGEIRQIMANHFTQSGSRIMFVTME